MLGIAKAVVGVAPSSPYSVNLNPGEVIVFSGNGSASSPVVYSTVVSGVGPFSYQWTITGSSITIVSATEANTRFGSAGYNDSFNEVATLTVTDTGNGNAETTRDIQVKFTFESQGL